MGNHRGRRSLAWLLVPAILALCAMAAVAVYGLKHMEAQPDTRTAQVFPTPVPLTTTVTEKAPPSPRALKPLQDLVPGDSVLYDALAGRPRCMFVEWFGSISEARIRCPGLPRLTVPTGFLTPVEADS